MVLKGNQSVITITLATCALAVLLMDGCRKTNTPPPAAGAEAKQTELLGVAKNAKAGAVLVLDSGNPVYIEGLSQWPDELLDQRVSARGVLLDEKMIPDPVVSKSGAISQGAHGDQTVLKNATWTKTPK